MKLCLFLKGVFLTVFMLIFTPSVVIGQNNNPFVVVIDAVMIVLLPKKQTAYEYVFVDGQIDFDAIYGGEQRVNIQKIDLEKVDIVAPEQSHALHSYQQIPLKDCSSGFDKDRHYIAVYRGDDGNSVRIRFTPDETLLNNMKAKARSKIQS